MSAKMWRDASEEQRKPYVETAEEMKRGYATALEGWRAAAGEWDRRAGEVRVEYERENPNPAGEVGETGLGEGGGGGRRSKVRVESYAEVESDVEMGDGEEGGQ